MSEKSLDVQRGEKLHKLSNELRELVTSATMHVYRLGEIMKMVRDEELWRESYESFASFYSDPEFDFNKGTVSRAIKMVELFKPEEVAQAPLGKIYDILPHITKENKKELLKMASGLSRSDLRHQLDTKRLVEARPKLALLPKIYPCEKCGKSKGISFEQLCHCGWSVKQVEYVGKLINHLDFGGDIDERDIDIS